MSPLREIVALKPNMRLLSKDKNIERKFAPRKLLETFFIPLSWSHNLAQPNGELAWTVDISVSPFFWLVILPLISMQT